MSSYPARYFSQNEIDAAKAVHLDYLNVQGQPHFTWAPSFALARVYVDQLARLNGLAADRIAAVRAVLKNAENASGDQRRDTLTGLARQLEVFLVEIPRASGSCRL